jgi:lactate dehydrogenase-like 2-hydroxyacid dehydrogenase
MRTLYYQRTRLPPAQERELPASYVPLETLMAESDWVVPVLPTSPSTRGLIGRAQFAQMKPHAMLVNIGLANTVDRDALIEALQSGRLGGFALDPLYEAPGRSDDELLAFPNVAISPHLSGSPRFNALDDLADMCEGIAQAMRD